MSFLALDRIIWLLIALPIVIFYILKPRLRRRKISTLLFWEQIFEEKRQRTLWQNLRHWLSLLLQLMFVGLLVMALIDPIRSAMKDQGQELVLIIDNSASMQAVDAESQTTRLQQAQQKADEFIVGLRPGDRCAVLTCGNVLQVVSGMTEFIPTLRDAVSRIQTTDSPSDIRNAILAARRLAPDSDRRRIVVISDTCDLAADTRSTTSQKQDEGLKSQHSRAPVDDTNLTIEFPDALSGKDTLWVAVGSDSRPANAAITTFQARRSTVDPLGYCLLAEVRNASDTPLKCRFKLELADALVDVFPLNLSPNEIWRKTINATSETGGLLVGSLDVDDALEVDNTAQAVVPSRPRIAVTLVKADQNDAYYLTSVLNAIPLLDLSVINESEYSAAAKQSPPDKDEASEQPDETFEESTASSANSTTSNSEIRRPTLTVFSGVTPATIPDGAVLIVGPEADGPKVIDGRAPAWTLGPKVESPLIAEQNQQSPLLRHVRLQNVLLDGGRNIIVNEQWGQATTLLKTAADDTVMVSLERPEGRVVVLSANLDSSDLPLRIAFPVMMTNSVNWFLRQSNDIQPALSTGSPARIPWAQGSLQENDTELLLMGPKGRRLPLQQKADRIIVGPQSETGIYAVLRKTATATNEMPSGQSKSNTAETSSAADQTQQLIQQAEASPDSTQLLTVNLCNAAESDLAKVKLPDQSDRSIPASGLPGWLWLVMIATGFIVLEWFFYHRRIVA